MAHRYFPAVQAAVLCHIADNSDREHGFRRFAWPRLSMDTWHKIKSDPTYADRQEFLGDSLAHSAIALRLRECYPTASPDSYTVRASDTTNTDLTYVS
jgi:hypothetical protein